MPYPAFSLNLINHTSLQFYLGFFSIYIGAVSLTKFLYSSTTVRDVSDQRRSLFSWGKLMLMRQGTSAGPGDISIWDRASIYAANTSEVMNQLGGNQFNEVQLTMNTEEKIGKVLMCVRVKQKKKVD